jgi:defect-in-organelle-trafficking protein DotC
LCLACAGASPAVAQTAETSPTLAKVMAAKSYEIDTDGITEVRASALRDVGEALGIRAGLIDGSKAAIIAIEQSHDALDARFNFGSLIMDNGALPPVIAETHDVVSVMDYSMRVAGKIWTILAPATFRSVAPTWRDYLYFGLVTDPDPVMGDDQRAVYPRNDKEQAFWKKVVTEGYAKGRTQARKIAELNKSRLERDYDGMWNYYELYRRGIVAAPIIASSTKLIDRPDDKTIVVGETVIRIVQQPKFIDENQQWKAEQ